MFVDVESLAMCGLKMENGGLDEVEGTVCERCMVAE